MLLGVTGSLIVFEDQIDGWLNPEAPIRPQGQRRSLDELTHQIEKTYPGYKVAGLNFPQRMDQPAGFFLLSETGDGKDMAVDPYTSRIIPRHSAPNNFTGKVHQLHTRLLMRQAGSTVVAYAAVILLFLAITGLVLWWPRKVRTVRWSGPGAKTNFDLHNALGFYSSPFLLVFALTGMVIHWEDPAARWLNFITRPPAEPEMAKPSRPDPAAVRITADQALAVAEKLARGATPSFMELGVRPGEPIRIVLKFPEDHTPAGRTQVFLDPYTGQVLLFNNTRTASFTYKYTRMWNRSIHTGDIFGWPTRILACLFSLALPLMAVTGPLIWWKRRRVAKGIAAGFGAGSLK